MAIRSLQMQQNMNTNMQHQQPNLTFYTTPFYGENNGSQFDDLDAMYTFDGSIESAGSDNFSGFECPSSTYDNITYLNVSCDAALNFSLPLYGEFVGVVYSIKVETEIECKG